MNAVTTANVSWTVADRPGQRAALLSLLFAAEATAHEATTTEAGAA